MKLFAKKPCSFGGKKFYIGDEIPGHMVLDPKLQSKQGVLVMVEDGDHPEAPAAPVAASEGIVTVPVSIHGKDGDMPLDLTFEGIQAIFDILNGKPADADAIIEKMTDGDALILLHVTDKREKVKTSAEARAKALSGEQEGEESVGEQ